MMHVADYFNSKENPGKGQAVLDPHHTHFILCDDGTQKKFNSEVAFRAKFETFVSAKMKNISASTLLASEFRDAQRIFYCSYWVVHKSGIQIEISLFRYI